MNKNLLLAALPALLIACASRTPEPPRAIPPELLNPAVTPQTLQQTICVPAYAASITPGGSAAHNQMLAMMQRAGVDPAMASGYVIDRRLPVGLGGHPTNPANLQLLEWAGEHGAQRKQALERRLRLMVCDGKISLREAQAAVYPDWVPSYARYMEGSGR